ncbi:MAG: glycosyl transferase [Actinobacteria bacterium]|nr:glycosyl transferase [Actinomycetota bacterium]
MRRSIAFYVHHHGHGHTSRARALIDALSLPATVLTSAPAGPGTFGDASVVELPRDDGESETTDVPTGVPAHLHYAPLGIPGLRERTARLARFLADEAPAVLVVDVSAEVAQLARIAGVPPVVVRQHGTRWDPAHVAAYDAAVALLAPFGRELEEPDAPEQIRRRTFYAGGLSRPSPDGSVPVDDVRRTVRRQLGWGTHEPGVVVLRGSGGSGPAAGDLRAAMRSTPDHRWVVVGREDDADDVPSTGWVDDPLPYLAAADVVVGSAGHNTVMEVALLRRPFVCVPEDRPFDEQRRKAERLRELDLAEVVDRWPGPADWPAVLTRARIRGGGRLGRIADPEAASRAASWLTRLADGFAA